jgi:2-polyprenyl-3-methyl-5-hydroxy-6-metoxy-1,4-benzoquinol methylase
MTRDYNQELKDTTEHKYAYGFDLDVMHGFMMKSFSPFFVDAAIDAIVDANILELGSFEGAFTKRLVGFTHNITCVEASSEAIRVAKKDPALSSVNFINDTFESVKLEKKYDNIIMTHVLEHLDDPVAVLSRINNEWLSKNGRLFVACPNANAPSRQIAVNMGLISHTTAVTPAEKEHGHKITYTLDTLERDTKAAGLRTIHQGGIFFKALANFQWDRLLQTDIISQAYLEGCFQLGRKYPDLCSSIFLVCEKSQ